MRSAALFVKKYGFMKKHTITLLLCLCVSCFAYAGSLVINFNARWHFILGDHPDFYKEDFDDSQWRTLDVPHDWSIEGKFDKQNPSGPQGGFMPCGIGWYRKTFEVDESLKDKRFFISFDGVYMKSQVWINERMVGEYPGGYNSFQYDITHFVRPGEKNVLAVKVDNSLQPGSRWYTGSGIYRDVNLIVTEQIHFTHDGTFAFTKSANEKKAVLKVKSHLICHAYPETQFNWTDNTSLFIWTRNEEQSSVKAGPNNRVKKPCTVCMELLDAEGVVQAKREQEKIIGDFTEHDFIDSLEIDNPRLWSSSSPNLYTLRITAKSDGQVMDSQEMKVGLREIAFSNKNGMIVNGKPEKIQGVCLHQSVGAFGTAVPRDVWRMRLVQLKEMGCNALRLSHYPHPRFIYDLCDELGLYVSNEIFDEWNRGQEWGYSETSYGKMPYTYHLYFDQWHETDLTRMIRRDRNHACVILYVLGNEIPNQRIKGIDIARELVQIAHREDPTRLVTAACDFFVGANIYGFMDEFDIAGYNYIDRAHKDSLYLAEATRYPDRVLLGTETYHHYKNQQSIKQVPSAIGEFVWVGYDYLGEIVWDGYRGWDAGILDVAGFPKAEYYLRKSYWSQEPVVHVGVAMPKEHEFDWAVRPIADHWNWTQDSTLTVMAYSNCDEVELSLNGHRIGRKAIPTDSCCISWNVPFKKGVLKAVGYQGKKKVAEHTLFTAEEPIQLVQNVIPGKEVDCVIVEAQDKKGHRNPLCNEWVDIEANGAKVIGIDNGTQYDPEGLKYTSTSRGQLYEGRLIFYVKKGQTEYKATVRSTAL